MAQTPETVDDVFTDAALPEGADVLDDGADIPDQTIEARKRDKTFFDEAREDEKQREVARLNDRRIGLLIGPKNLEKLRAFGYDVSKVSDGPLTPGVAHRGLTD